MHGRFYCIYNEHDRMDGNISKVYESLLQRKGTDKSSKPGLNPQVTHGFPGTCPETVGVGGEEASVPSISNSSNFYLLLLQRALNLPSLKGSSNPPMELQIQRSRGCCSSRLTHFLPLSDGLVS